MPGPAARAGAAVLVLGVLTAAGARPAAAQIFSPGELARPHAAFEGLKNCTRCHEEGQKLSAAKCLACHTELRGRIQAGRGLHGRLSSEDRQTCQKCHKDHEGRDFKMIDWGAAGVARFDHRRTGFALGGKHARLDCKRCHDAKLVADTAVKTLLHERPERKTFLGLPTACSACHFDEHRGQEGKACEKCHDEAGWKPVPRFDHGQTEYPLTGKHKALLCTKCHPQARDEAPPAGALAPRAATFLKMKGIEHGACTDCHADPHKGQLGATCGNCHDTGGWLRIKAAGGGGGGGDRLFHDKTRYPLRGRHVDVECKACHGPFPGQAAKFRGLSFAHCTDCHADSHLGQLEGPCERCHKVDGFLPARFEAEDHDKTRFRLEGAHGLAACRRCHPVDEATARRLFAAALPAASVRGPRATRLSFTVFHPGTDTARCESCHDDPHGGQLPGRAGKTGCAACHGTTAFRTVSFVHDKDTRFPLEGAHARVACGSCHGRAPAGRDGRPGPVVYKGTPVTCAGCHSDVHYGQLARPGAATTDCTACHTPSAWKPSRFSHDDARLTTFRLEGKHAGLACARCHPTVALPAGPRVVRYRPLPRACEDCHEDFHRGAYRRFQK